jgi:HAD superfamily hydrolase (TIGR01509 family)
VPVRGVVFDVGNVIVRWGPRTLYSKIFPDPAERDWFLANVCTMEWHIRHDAGVSFAENRVELIRRFPKYEAAIVAWGDRWWEMFSGPIPETEAAIEAMHARGVPMFGLTNMSAETSAGTFSMSPAFGRLNHIVVSAEVGFSKPDPRIFKLVAQRAKLEPCELLFVDDTSRHVEAAAALGFATHHLTDPATLRPALVELGLL